MKKQVVGYLTPDTVPEESHCRVLRIPADTAWLSTFMGALLPLADPASWQKYGDLSVEEAADAALNVIWDAYTVANQECPLDVRQNEESPCILEKNDGGGWTEFANLQLCPPLVVIGADGTPYISDDGGATYHPAPVEPLPRTPVIGQDSKCLAAANGTAAMAAFYAQVAQYFSNEVLLLVALGGVIALVLALLGLPIALGAAIEAFTELWAVFSSFFSDDFDSDKQDIYRCILFCHSNLVDDVVTFDYDGVLGAVDELWTPISDFNVWTAVHYLLLIIGGDGLQRAGATTSIASADCGDCDCPSGECYEFNFSDGDPGATACVFYGEFSVDHYAESCFGGIGSDAYINVGLHLSQNGSGCPIDHIEIDIEPIVAGCGWEIYGSPTDNDPCTTDLVLLASGTTVSTGIQTVGGFVDGSMYVGVRVITSQTGGCGTTDVNWYAVRIQSSDLAAAGLPANC